MDINQEPKHKWTFQKTAVPKYRTNNTAKCPCIHLPKLQFQSQDYETIIPSNHHTTYTTQTTIDCVNALLSTFTMEQQPKRLHIVHISDTHLSYNDYIIPFKKNILNILIHSGDLSYMGCLSRNGAIPNHYKQVSKWLRNLPHHKKIVIAGNHDIAFSQLGKDKIHPFIFNSDPNVIYLQDDIVNLYGMNIYGTPWTDRGAFKRKKQEYLVEKWKQIPNGLDILISHQHPAVFTQDGDEDLLHEVVSRVMPKVHLFGHDHSNIGCKVYEDIMFVNSAMDKLATPHVFDVVFDL